VKEKGRGVSSLSTGKWENLPFLILLFHERKERKEKKGKGGLRNVLFRKREKPGLKILYTP